MDKNKYSALKYGTTVRNVIVFSVLLMLSILLFILDPDTKTEWYHIVIPLAFGAFILCVIYFGRNITINTLHYIDLDMKKVYELDKRKDTPKNREHNLMLMIDVYFYNGDFQRALDCCYELMNISKDTGRYYFAQHRAILSHFFLGNYNETRELIEIQRKTKGKYKKTVECCNIYYDYIELYLNEEYEKAVEKVNLILLYEENVQLNSRKVLVAFLKMQAYEKLGNEEAVKECEREIICFDKNRLTYFSKIFFYQQNQQ